MHVAPFLHGRILHAFSADNINNIFSIMCLVSIASKLNIFTM